MDNNYPLDSIIEDIRSLNPLLSPHSLVTPPPPPPQTAPLHLYECIVTNSKPNENGISLSVCRETANELAGYPIKGRLLKGSIGLPMQNQ